MKKENTVFDFGHNYEPADILAKVKAKNKGKPKFNFLDGPVTANAPLCLHHGWGRTLKDAYNRYNSLIGKEVDYVWGFDAQGMWVEVEVEKLLGLNNKKEITQYGVDKFTEKCIERVNFFKNHQTEQSKLFEQLGDWEHSYITNSDQNITSIWHFLKVCHDKKMLKRSYKTMPWCPRCGTSLSEHEMSGSYKERTHKAVFVKAKLVGRNERILVWTTTPWTLAANMAIAVNPEFTYCKCQVKSDKNLLIVCEKQLKVLRDDLVKVVEKVSGADLVGLVYEPFLNLQKQQFEHKIVAWDQVDEIDGSGAVHIAPGCGAEDFALGTKLNMAPFIIPVAENGTFYEDFEWLAGLTTVECEPAVFEHLTQNQTLYYHHDYTHNYPFCWRCKTDVIFRLVEGYDIATDGIRKDLLKAADTVHWTPDFMGKSMRQWLTDMGDWNISRRRFYGLPLPFYPCKKCGHLNVIDSKEELRARAVDPSKVDALPHLHRPYIDEVQIICEKCHEPVARVTDVGDCWLDAGIVPFSTKPKGQFKADMVLEMKEQIRLWFYSQLFMSVVLTGEAPYKNVVGHSTIVDEDGKKFSKTGPRKIYIEDVAKQYGTDVLRYAFASANPTLDMRFGDSIAEDAKRRLLAIWNAYVFYTTYALVDKPDVKNYQPENLAPIDLWLVQLTNQYIQATREAYDQFKIHQVVKLTDDFVENISNFYIRVNRRRYWKNGEDQDKMNAYWCLFQALRSVTIVITPLVPSYAQYLWQNCFGEGEEPVMLANYPTALKVKSRADLLKPVEFVKQIISLGLSLRAENQIAIKQPLSKVYVKTNQIDTVTMFAAIIQEQLNVKQIEIVTDDEKFNVAYLTVNFKKAGAILKNRVQELKNALQNSQQMAEYVAAFDAGEKINIAGFDALTPDLFERKLAPRSGFVITTENDVTVVLDTQITDDLMLEGIARELIRSIQLERMNQKMEITDRIVVELKTGDNKTYAAACAHQPRIMREVLATEMHITQGKGKNEIHIRLA
ncbi:MAG: isoleucine--tRNA ligase [Eubacteriales bacterium]|nr:isoleucine--tRNA ligase [Eubacteriales bacterium]